MEWAFKFVDIKEDKVRIRKLVPEDFYRVAQAIHDPESFIAKTWEINTPDKIVAMLAKIHNQHLLGLCNPFVFECNGDIAGISRFFRFDEKRRSLEIGGTWIAPNWRRTEVNTQAKYLMMKVAFEEFEAERIEYVVNCNNYISQMAVLRIGATLEGTMRRTYVSPEGTDINALLYSVTRPDWPRVKMRLKNLQARAKPPSDFLPYEFTGKNLTLKLYNLTEAAQLKDIIQRNIKTLRKSFPKTGAVTTEANANAYIAERAHRFADKTGATYGVWSKDKLIGQIAVQNVKWDLREADAGYYIDAEMRQQGYATEAMTLVLNHLMRDLNFNRLTIRTLPENNESLRLAKKLGFQQEGLLRSGFVTGDGERRDMVLLSLVNES